MEFLITNQELSVKKIILTGGPCSGKTTAMSRLRNYLQSCGYRVFLVPEAATLLFLNGFLVDDFSKPGCPFAFQKAIIRTQIHLEDTFTEYAKAVGTKSIVLCDRGTMDGKAYVDDETWTNLLGSLYLDEDALLSRYDTVFHLVTAADGAEDYYTLENNAARSEGLEEARRVDGRSQSAWERHTNHIVIDNSFASFEHKIRCLLTHVADTLSISLPATSPPVSYAIQQVPDISRLPKPTVLLVEKIYLLESFLKDTPSKFSDVLLRMRPPTNEVFVNAFITKSERSNCLRWFMHKHFELTVVTKKDSLSSTDGGCGGSMTKVLSEYKRSLSDEMHDYLLTFADPSKKKLKQKRYFFLANNDPCLLLQLLLEDSGTSAPPPSSSADWILRSLGDKAPDAAAIYVSLGKVVESPEDSWAS